MQIKIDENEDGKVITLEEDSKIFTMFFAGNLDLYWTFDNLDEDYFSKNGEFYITKENYYIYSLFEKLYEDISKCEIIYGNSFEMLNITTLFDLETMDSKKEEHREFIKHSSNYEELYNNGIITWISDDRDYRFLYKAQIIKDEDMFIINFSREKNEDNNYSLGARIINIRFRNSGSSYDPFNVLFMNLYNGLCKYDPNDKQIHIEEYLYSLKKEKIKKHH